MADERLRAATGRGCLVGLVLSSAFWVPLVILIWWRRAA